MAANVVALGRRVLVGLVLLATALELMADALAAVVGKRFAEAAVYVGMTVVTILVGAAIDSVKSFLGE